MISAYDLLNVSNTATEEEILRAYRKAMLRYHPDHNSSPEAVAKAKQLNRAKDLLTDPVKRARYDQYLERMRQRATSKPTGSSDTKNANSPTQSTPKTANEGHRSTAAARDLGGVNQSQYSQSTDTRVGGKSPPKRRKRSSAMSSARGVVAILTGSFALWILVVFLFDIDPLQIRTKLRIAFSGIIGKVRDTANSQPRIADLAKSDPYEAREDKTLTGNDEDTNRADEKKSAGEVLIAPGKPQGKETVGSSPKQTPPPSITELEPKIDESRTDAVINSSASQDDLLPLPSQEQMAGTRDLAKQLVLAIVDGNQGNPQRIAIEVFKAADANSAPEMKLAILESILELSIDNLQPAIALDAVKMIENTFQTSSQYRSLDALRKMISRSPVGFDNSIFTIPLISIAQKSAKTNDYITARDAFQIGVRLIPKAMRKNTILSVGALKGATSERF
jgi:curved DNA-binding protein CbpA